MAACPTKGQLSFLAKNRGNDEDQEGDVRDDDVHGDVGDDRHGSPAYSHQSKSHHGGVLTVMIMVGICHRRIPTIEYNDDDDNDNEKNRTTDINTFQCGFPPIENNILCQDSPLSVGPPVTNPHHNHYCQNPTMVGF